MEIGELRRDALAAFSVALESVQPAELLAGALRYVHPRVTVLGSELPQVRGRRVVLAAGKAALSLAAAWSSRLPGWASEMLILVPYGVPQPPGLSGKVTILRGAHPVPDFAAVAAARQALRLADELGRDELLVVLLSGGASAMLSAPVKGLGLQDVAFVTRRLLESGAPITALNTVRHWLLAAAGGGLARAAVPAQVVTLVISDVIGDRLASIGSGPTVPTATTPDDALAVLARYGFGSGIPLPIRRAIASAVDRQPFPSRSALPLVLGNNRTAVASAAAFLRHRYQVLVVQEPLLGEAAARGCQLGALAAAVRPTRPTALVLGGETTVTVSGHGQGGRNQELALAAALQLDGATHPCTLLAAGTDGVDGPTSHAGAVVDPTTCRRLQAAGGDARAALADNDSATALATTGDAITTGPTGTNVCDLTLVLVAPTRSYSD